MVPDQHPIPREALPPGWGPAECCEDHLAYRHARPPIELTANRTAAESHPGLGLCHCWELQYRYSLGERSITESIGSVSTRRAAVEGLLECMTRVNERVEDPFDPIETQAVLEGIALADAVPDEQSKSI